MKRLFLISLAAICCLVALACQKRYVGQSVDYNWHGWCKYAKYYNNGEKHCTIDSGALIFDVTIRKGEKDGEYIIEGFVDPTKGEIKSWDKMLDGPSRFSMIVAHNGKVIDNVAFRPKTVFGGMGTQWPFRINYIQPEGFDAVTFTWNIHIRG
jgi:hypothetical protein